MINYVLFFLVIFLANIIQGITGFAGTILAMPFSLIFVGYNVAKPLLNVIGLLSGIYVFMGQRKYVCWKELKKIVIIMSIGIIIGINMKGFFLSRERLLYKSLGIFVVMLSFQGIYIQIHSKSKNKIQTYIQEQAIDKETATKDSPILYIMLILAGVVHGIIVAGGPLLIGYLTKKIKDNVSFRATISTVWVFLNTMILIDDIHANLWTSSLIKIQLILIPILLIAMFIGSKLYAKMSQYVFIMITYILLLVSGISLLAK